MNKKKLLELGRKKFLVEDGIIVGRQSKDCQMKWNYSSSCLGGYSVLRNETSEDQNFSQENKERLHKTMPD